MDSSIHSDDQSVESRGLTIPPWALWLLCAQGTAFVLFGIPWSVWVTYTLLSIQFTSLSGADGQNIVSKMEARFDKLDAKFENLQRDFDRSAGKIGVVK
jgi:hypothetical protein